LTYLTVPVMAKFTAPGGFYFELGPQVGFKLGEDYGDQTFDDFANDLDLSAGAGIGFKLGPVGIGGRYLVGLSKVGDFDTGTTDPDFKNSVIQVGVSFRL
ncbi:MAG: PorT family protein, partial [Chitinophagaceae bacterium]